MPGQFTEPADLRKYKRNDLLKEVVRLRQRNRRLEEMFELTDEAMSNLTSTWEVASHHLETGLDA